MTSDTCQAWKRIDFNRKALGKRIHLLSPHEAVNAPFCWVQNYLYCPIWRCRAVVLVFAPLKLWQWLMPCSLQQQAELFALVSQQVLMGYLHKNQSVTWFPSVSSASAVFDSLEVLCYYLFFSVCCILDWWDTHTSCLCWNNPEWNCATVLHNSTG